MTNPDPMDVLLAFKLAAVEPLSSGKPARELTQAEARDLVVWYTLNKQLNLPKPITFGKDGSVTFPKVGEKVPLGLDIGGVHFQPDNKDAQGHTATGPMDLRTAVLAVRLSQWLKASRWAVTTIFWGGMGTGRADVDRHGKGFAIDFHGAITRLGKMDVNADWGSKTITLPGGRKVPAWPADARTFYRLDLDNDRGGQFFYDVYHWLTGEAADGRAGGTSIGDHSWILCPDMPDITKRDLHQDHIHCEIDR